MGFFFNPTNMKFLQEFINKVEHFVDFPDIFNYPQSDIPVFFYINLSVLSGEYYSEKSSNEFYPELKEELKKLKLVLERFDNRIQFIQAADKRKSLREITPGLLVGMPGMHTPKQQTGENAKITKLKELRSFLKKIQGLYQKLIEKAERDFSDYGKINNLYNDYEIFDIELNVELFRHEYDEIEVRDSEKFEFDIFQINVKLAELDINLDCENGTINKLTSYLNFLNRLQSLSNQYTRLILRILLDKTRFLLYKIFLRRHNHLDDESTEQSYYSTRMNDLKKDISFYKNFLIKSDHHYAPKKQVLDNELSLKLDSKKTTFKISELHKLGKYYRCMQSLAGIDKVIQKAEFVKEVDYLNFGYGEFAKASANNLLKNTRLRIILEQEAKDGYKTAIGLLRDRNSIEFNKKYLPEDDISVAAIFRYKDYYPYIQLFIFFEGLFDELIDDPLKLLPEERVVKLKEDGKDLKEDLEKLFKENGAFDLLEKCIEQLTQQFNHKLKYCEHKKYKPVYLTYDECKYPAEIEDIKKIIKGNETDLFQIDLFVESSYVLPVDYEEIKSDWKGVKSRMNRKINTLKNTLKIEYQLKFSEKSFRKEVENKEFKLVQALAMFIAIATLILGSIKATEGRSVLSSLLIIVGLGSVLMLFNYFIYWFIRVDKTIKTREYIVLGFITAFIASSFLLSQCNDENLIKLKSKTDSLEMYRHLDTSLANCCSADTVPKPIQPNTFTQKASTENASTPPQKTTIKDNKKEGKK